MTELKSISIHRALTELKTLESRISAATTDVCTILANRKSNTEIKGKTVEDIKKQMQGSHDKVVGLIKYRNALKEAIVQSNATTIVNVGGEEMTVAKAIERKDSISYEKNLLSRLMYNYRTEVGKYNKENEALPAKLETYLTNILGGRDKATLQDIDIHTETFMARNEWELIDPLKTEELITKLDDQVNAFMTDVDAVLSESNAVTMIEVVIA